jgi:hypothetical protein
MNFPAVDEYENEPTASNYYRRRTNIFRRSNGVITTGVKQTLVTAWQGLRQSLKRIDSAL